MKRYIRSNKGLNVNVKVDWDKFLDYFGVTRQDLISNESTYRDFDVENFLSLAAESVQEDYTDLSLQQFVDKVVEYATDMDRVSDYCAGAGISEAGLLTGIEANPQVVEKVCKEYFTESINSAEQIEVKHEGILEVPEGKSVDDLPVSHFKKLIDKKGREAIIRALTNLEVWNKNDDKSLSDWAKKMKKSLEGYGAVESATDITDEDVDTSIENINNQLSKRDYDELILKIREIIYECLEDEMSEAEIINTLKQDLIYSDIYWSELSRNVAELMQDDADDMEVWIDHVYPSCYDSLFEETDY